MSRPPLSIVIPTLNAAGRLEACLTALVPGLASGLVREALIVDAGSTDATCDLARDMGCKVVIADAANRGRGPQLALGGQAATGEWLLFLHADTVLSPGWDEVVFAHLGKGENMAGFFELRFASNDKHARRIANLANWRARFLGLPYGDQGLLISRSLYQSIGGFTPLPLMEDVDLVRRLGNARLTQLSAQAETSAARYEAGGWWFVPLRNLLLLAGFLVGVSPQRLKSWYR
jgi:rSAM/selenodomain-associated transferase 2